MLRPQTNACRDALSLDGFWRLTPDPEGAGEGLGWARGTPQRFRIAVPGSWNEQLAEAGLMNYDGIVWYERDFVAPGWIAGRRQRLYFGAVDFAASVFLDGEKIGAAALPFLPFEIDVTGRLTPGRRARLVLRVEGRLSSEGATQPVTRADYAHERRLKDEYFPAVRFDFFPYAGIHRSVHLCAEGPRGLRAAKIEASAADGEGLLRIEARTDGADEIAATIGEGDEQVKARRRADGGKTELSLRLPSPRLWDVGNGALYPVVVEAIVGGAVVDRYETRVGFRSIAVGPKGLTLNGRPVTLRGFGKHEEGPLRGRATDPAQIVKDFALMDWCGANSFRTSHYPYSEEWLDAADEAGVLVISELFSVNLDFRRTDASTLAAHRAALEAQIARDGARPSVIAWSLANEPGYLGEEEARRPAARNYWRELYAAARALDPTRPLTHAHVAHAGDDDPAFEFDDFLSLNRYYGWYQAPGQLDEAERLLREDIRRLSERYGKPVLLTEFGADAVPGMHATDDQLFTEEYQSALIECYWRAIEAEAAAIGGHVWSFSDFRTAQHSRRVVFNFKGVFTRDRSPKAAAWKLRELWSGKKDDVR